MRKIYLASVAIVMALVLTDCKAVNEETPFIVAEHTKIITQATTATLAEPETTTLQTTDTTPQTAEATTLEISSDLEELSNDEDDDVKQITFSFLGDCTLGSMNGKDEPGNMVNYLNNKPTSYFMEKTMPWIGSDDFTIANCETVLSDNAVTGVSKDGDRVFWFRSNTKNAFVFADNSIDAVSLANNHTNDYGADGLAETKKALDDAGVLWGNNLDVIRLEKYGIKFGIICAKFFGSYQQDAIVQKIKEISEDTDIQIVFFHGGTENIHEPEQWKIDGCHSFVDNGADLVVGGHPHVLQPYEEYNGVSIIYSIGNFCYGGHRHPENKTVVYQQTFSFDANNNLLESHENIVPFYVFTGDTNNWQPSPVEDEGKQNEILDFLYNGLN